MHSGKPRGGGPSGPHDIDGGLGLGPSGSLEDVRRFSHEAMNTVFEVYAVHPDQRYASQAAQAAFDLVDRLENELSRFRSNSDITRINHLASGESTRVGAAALECLVIAQHIHALTGGTFDISIGTGLDSLELDVDESVVHAGRDGVRVDLGGIGKGYAVDLVGELLEDWGIERALVHGGFSSVLAMAPPSGGDGWPLTLSDPAEPSRVLVRLALRQTALSASGIRKTDHIVDPRTGHPVRGRSAAWAALSRPGPSEGASPTRAEGRLAPAAVADALTTALMMLSVEAIEGLCARSPGLEVWILPHDGELQHFGGCT